MRRIFILLIIPVFCLAQESGKNAGTVSALFLRTDVSTRVAGLSGTYTAVANDESALLYNPAGLANLGRAGFALNHASYFEDTNIENILLAYNFEGRLGFAIGMTHIWMPDIQGYDYLGAETNPLKVSSSVVHLGLAYKIQPAFYAGLGLKYVQDDLAGYSANALAMDAGIFIHTMLRGLTFGAVVQNFGSGIRYDLVDEELPLTLRAGLAYKPWGKGLRLAADMIYSKDRSLYFSGAAEFIIAQAFILRSGNTFSNANVFNPTFGGGLRIYNQYVIDYAFNNHADLGAVHRFGVSFQFNLPKSTEKYRTPKVSDKPVTIKIPEKIRFTVKNDKVIIYWSKVDQAQFNMYVRPAEDQPWVLFNMKPIDHNWTHIDRSAISNGTQISVTAVIGMVESGRSEEVTFHEE